MTLGNIQKDNGGGTGTTYYCENLGPMFQQKHIASWNTLFESTIFP